MQLIYWTIIYSVTYVSISNRDAKWCSRNDGRFLGVSWDGDVEGGAWDVVIAPLNHQDVVAPLSQHIADIVLQIAQVFDQNLLTGDLRTVHTHQEHVLTWEVERKTCE